MSESALNSLSNCTSNSSTHSRDARSIFFKSCLAAMLVALPILPVFILIQGCASSPGTASAAGLQAIFRSDNRARRSQYSGLAEPAVFRLRQQRERRLRVGFLAAVDSHQPWRRTVSSRANGNRDRLGHMRQFNGNCQRPSLLRSSSQARFRSQRAAHTPATGPAPIPPSPP